MVQLVATFEMNYLLRFLGGYFHMDVKIMAIETHDYFACLVPLCHN